mmetsp:Transcript_86936/g.241072  ORF Transcript_86936/g.241072 Transcript_86936/m.241072 type:complete len:688 (+) Transcript_86936:687-2750(+)
MAPVLRRRPAQPLRLQPAARARPEVHQGRLGCRPPAARDAAGEVLKVLQLPLRLVHAVRPLRAIRLPQPEPQAALLEAVVLLSNSLTEPLRNLHARARIGNVLVGSWDANELLKYSAETLLVVLPVDDCPHIEVREGRVLQPLSQPGLLHLVVRAEDLHGDGTLGAAGVVRLVGDQHVAADAFVLQEAVHTQEIGQSLGRCDLHRLVATACLNRLAHRLRFREEVDHLIVGHRFALRLDDIQPTICHLADYPVNLFLRIPFEELRENLGLEDLDQAELAAPFDFEALELGERAIKLKDGVTLLEHLVLLCAGWENHGLVGPIDLEEDRVLILHCPLTGRRSLLVLMVGVLLMDAVVQHTVGVGHLDFFAPLHLELEGVGEALGQQTPDAISVELQRQPHLFAELPCLADEIGASVGDDARHLHGVPPCTLAHDVPVERVQDALMGKLQRVVQQYHVLRLHFLRQVAALLCFLKGLVPFLCLPLKQVSPVAEIAHGVHVERVLALADSVSLVLVDRALQAPVCLLGELTNCLSDLRSLLLLIELTPLHTGNLVGVPVLVVVSSLVALHLVHYGPHVCPCGHVQFTTPLPVHGPFALVGWVIVSACIAELFRDDCRWLQAVRQNDVRVHGTDIQVVDQRIIILDHSVGGLLHLLTTRLDATLPLNHLVLDKFERVAVLLRSLVARLRRR